MKTIYRNETVRGRSILKLHDASFLNNYNKHIVPNYFTIKLFKKFLLRQNIDELLIYIFYCRK